MTPPRVPCLFPPPCRENALNAISRAILRIRSKGVSRGELAKLIDVSVDVIDSASNEESLLNFTAIALIGYHFPEEFGLVETLWNCIASAPLTIADRLERIASDTAAIAQEVGR